MAEPVPTPPVAAPSALDLLMLSLQPEPFTVFKPRKGAGTAMQVQLRLSPEFVPNGAGGTYIRKSKRQGVFLELAAEGPMVNGFPTFGWRNDDLVRVKLGLADITRLLAAIREVRALGKELPSNLRAKADQPYTVGAFHKFNGATAAISYAFEAERSALQVSRQPAPGAPAQRRSITLNLDEEVAFEHYLRLALDGLLKVGLR